MQLKMKRSASRIALLMAALCIATPQAFAQVENAEPPATASVATEKAADRDVVIVTATKRETVLDDTPQSIAVLDGDDQFAKGQTRFEDLSVSVPNVNFASTSNTSQFYVRGIGNTFLAAGGDPGVALYQDNAYVSDQTTTNVSMFDVARVEVLRGPQGALYGRNAVGGAINIISNEPTSSPEGRLAATAGDFGRMESEGHMSGPLGFADTDARLSFQMKHHDGYIKNELAGQPGAPDAFNDLDSQALRFQTLTQLPSNGEIRLLVSYYRQSDVGDALAVTPTPGVEYAVETLYGATPSTDPFSVRANLGGNKVRVYTGNAEYRQPIGENDLTITGNYRESTQFFQNDCDGTVIDNCRYVRNNTGHDYYVDAHLSGPTDPAFQWLIGATYLRFKIDQLNDVTFPFPASYLDPAASPTTPFGFRVFSGGEVDVESYAVYSDLRLRINNIWAVTGQVRYASTEKDAHERLTIADFGLDVPDFPNALSETNTPFKLGVEGQLNPDLLIYANYSTAFKDGAINLGALQATPVRPESVNSYEAGIKATLFNEALQFNAAAFHNTYEDLQISQLAGTVIALTNVPESTIDGLEVELTARPFEGFEASLGLGYLDATMDQFTNSRILPGLAGGPVEDLSGNQLPYVARYTANLAVSYSFTPLAGYDASIGGTYSYRSRTFFNEFNDDFNSQAPVGLLDLSGSFGPENESWRGFVYVRNVTDETVRTGATIYSGLIGAARAVSYAAPRHFGVGISFSY